MGKKIASYCFVAGVLALCLTMGAGVLLFGPAPAGANEILSGPPALTDAAGRWNMEFLPDAADWFADHFFPRQTLISLHNALEAELFNTSGAPDVLLGRNGWLYYGQTVNDYTGLEPMTERELYSAARNLALMEEYCRSRGQAFLFVTAPNKNSLYPQRMPALGAAAQTRNVERLFALLDRMNVSYLDLYAAFDAQEETLYFAHDSHWNEKGAALAADAINAALGRESAYYAGDFSGRAPHSGDLFEMLYPAFPDDETAPVYGGELNFTYAGSATRPDSVTLRTESGGNGTLLCFRDSFGNLLYPYLADSFAAARFSRATSYDLTAEAENVVIELVERNLRYLIANAPVMPAPRRQVTLPGESGTVRDVSTETMGNLEGMIRLRGTLPETPDTGSPVYVCCGGQVYEAFCMEDNGFAAIVPDGTPEGVLFQTEGELRLLAINES